MDGQDDCKNQIPIALGESIVHQKFISDHITSYVPVLLGKEYNKKQNKIKPPRDHNNNQVIENCPKGELKYGLP